MPRAKFYRPGDPLDAVRRIADDRVDKSQTEATVANVLPSGRVQVHLRGSAQLTPVDTPIGGQFSVGDRVFLKRSIETNQWTIISTFSSSATGSPGSGNASPGSPSPLAPPGSITVVPSVNIVTIQWPPAGLRTDILYDVQTSSDNPQVTIISTTRVTGSVCAIAVTPGSTYYFAVRSVDTNGNTSSWSSVVSGASIPANVFGADYTFVASIIFPSITSTVQISPDATIKGVSRILIKPYSMSGFCKISIGSTILVDNNETDLTCPESFYEIGYHDLYAGAVVVDVTDSIGTGGIMFFVTATP